MIHGAVITLVVGGLGLLMLWAIARSQIKQGYATTGSPTLFLLRGNKDGRR